jgi:hypothetical protein
MTNSMLVNYTNTTNNNNETSLQFTLVHYGFNQYFSIITQPRITLKNGQTSEMKFAPYKLKFEAQKHE